MGAKRSILAVSCCLVLLAAAPRQKSGAPLYDPSADPFRDLEDAIVEAQASGRHILLNVGGEWCGWCHILEKYLHDNQDILELLNKNFVVVKVNYSSENRNEKFLSQYPRIPAYPYFFVLDSDGTFLHAQRTGPLEEGRSYDRAKMVAFLTEWGPQ